MTIFTIRVRLHDSAPIHLRKVGAVIRIVDSTMADAESSVVRERRFRDLRYDDDQPWLVVVDFRLSQPPKRIWTVDVLVDVDGDGLPSIGDFVNTQSYPLQREGGEIDVVAKRIRRVTV